MGHQLELNKYTQSQKKCTAESCVFWGKSVDVRTLLKRIPPEKENLMGL